MAKRVTNPEIRRIIWIDSDGRGSWHGIGDVASEPATCESVGFVVVDNEHVTTLAQSFDHRPLSMRQNVDNTICIPKVAIVSQNTIRKAR